MLATSTPLKHWPKFADILHALESQHFVDQRCASCVPQDRRDEVARFRNYLLARHRILGCPAYISDPLAHLCAVGERHFNNGFASRTARVDPRVGNDFYFSPLSRHAWILHSCLVMRGLERGRLIQKTHST